MLILSSQSGAQPKSGDKVRVWYAKAHTIQSLDAGAATTVFPLHETGIVTGAAAYAAGSTQIDQIGNIHVDPGQVPSLNLWATEHMAEFRTWLATLVDKRTVGALKPTLAARNP